MGFFGRLFGGGKKKDDDGLGPCVACDATDLTELGPDAYRCNLCGYEGGDGYAALKAERARAAMAALPEPELRARIARDTNDLRLLLVAASGAVARPGVDVDIDGDSFSLSLERAGFSLEISFDLGGGPGVGAPGVGALANSMASVDAEEAARIRREREMQLFEASTAAGGLRDLVATWSQKDPAPTNAQAVRDLTTALKIEETSTNQACVRAQAQCIRIMHALT